MQTSLFGCKTGTMGDTRSVGFIIPSMTSVLHTLEFFPYIILATKGNALCHSNCVELSTLEVLLLLACT